MAQSSVNPENLYSCDQPEKRTENVSDNFITCYNNDLVMMATQVRCFVSRLEKSKLLMYYTSVQKLLRYNCQTQAQAQTARSFVLKS